MRTQNVLLIHNSFEPYRIPLFNELAKQKGIRLTVLFLSPSTSGKETYRNYLSSMHFNSTILPGVSIPVSSSLRYIINPPIFRYLINSTYDVVIIGGWQHFASQVMTLARIFLHKPYIIWSTSTMYQDSMQRRITLPFVRWIVKRACACIAGGTRAKEYFELLGARTNQIYVAFNSVDITYFAKKSVLSLRARRHIRRTHGVAGDEDTVFLSVGQFIHRKGVDILIRAFAEVVKNNRNAVLWIIGQGKMRQRYDTLIKQLHLTGYVRIIPYVANIHLALYYAAADVFVFPSREDTWGLVVNEAMACGLPVIVSASAGSATDLVKNGENGYTLAINKHTDLASCMERFVRRPELRIAMGKRSKQFIWRFRAKHSARVFLQAIERSCIV